jgi:hypothetical protein
MSILIRQVCKGDVWDFSAGTVEGMILLHREGGNSCGFVAQYNDTEENRLLYHHLLDRPVMDFIFNCMVGIFVAICVWALGFLIIYPFYHRIKFGVWPPKS